MGWVIAETAATGRFIIGDISWESAVGPNADTTVAYHATGELKIFEPLGMSLFDYIKGAAYRLGVDNHLDARFLLEIEILAEKTKDPGSAFKYIWPIMFLATEVKSSVTERGTEYVIRFVHLPYHAQTDLVQPVKETITVKDVGTLKEYFKGLQKELEIREFKYALARQKTGGTKAGAGNNPAFADDYHDEYHFVLDPKIENFGFTTKGTADRGIQGGFLNKFRSQKIWDISIRPGTTIIQQINRVLKSTEDIANLLPGKKTPQTPDASGSSQASSDNLLGQLGSVYQFFRIETHCVYKKFDHIRGRYATRYIFFIFLADQPNMYHYPDELNLLNRLKNKDKALTKLKYYIQEGLLRKLYYHNYTGLNTDILKVDLNFNQAYFLPSFPVIWMDRGYTGAGLQQPQNNSQAVNAYVHADELGAARRQVSVLREQANAINTEIRDIIQSSGGENVLNEAPGLGLSRGSKQLNERKQRYRELKILEEKVKAELAIREQEYAAKSQPTTNLNTINDRKQLLDNLKGQYIEDLTSEKFKQLLDNYIAADYPNIRPRMEPDDILTQIDDPKKENEKLMEKIFAVQVAPRDIVELELEIIGDPYWLGAPNFLLQGKKHLEKIQFSPENDQKLRSKINEVMPTLDPGWNDRNPVWGENYDISQHYKGAPLFYFLSQIPDSEFTEDDMIKFNANDQVVGIYMVKKVVNEFKEGRWTQKITSVRDITIPSYILPRTVTGQLSFEEYMKDVVASPDRARDTFAELRKTNEAERAANAAGNKITSTNPPGTNASPTLVKALDAKNNLVDQRQDIPTVRNPVDRANELVALGASKDQAYSQAKKEYIEQLNSKNKVLEEINKKAYAESGVGDYRPYSAETMTSLALTRSGAGGLDAWKSGKAESLGSSIYNNPAGTGYDKSNNSYYRYNTFDEGIDASNDYFNYAQNVKSKNKQDSERLLLPKDYKGSELEYLNKKLKSGGGG